MGIFLSWNVLSSGVLAYAKDYPLYYFTGTDNATLTDDQQGLYFMKNGTTDMSNLLVPGKLLYSEYTPPIDSGAPHPKVAGIAAEVDSGPMTFAMNSDALYAISWNGTIQRIVNADEITSRGRPLVFPIKNLVRAKGHSFRAIAFATPGKSSRMKIRMAVFRDDGKYFISEPSIITPGNQNLPSLGVTEGDLRITLPSGASKTVSWDVSVDALLQPSPLSAFQISYEAVRQMLSYREIKPPRREEAELRFSRNRDLYLQTVKELEAIMGWSPSDHPKHPPFLYVSGIDQRDRIIDILAHPELFQFRQAGILVLGLSAAKPFRHAETANLVFKEHRQMEFLSEHFPFFYLAKQRADTKSGKEWKLNEYRLYYVKPGSGKYWASLPEGPDCASQADPK